MHGLGLPRVPVKPPTAATNKYTWEKPRGSGTLESIVNQATSFSHQEKPRPLNGDSGGGGGVYGNFMVPWFDPHAAATTTTTTTNTMTMDALVPCSNREQGKKKGMESGPGTCMVGCSTRVGSCCGGKGAKGHEATGRDQSVSGSATFGRDSKHVTLDTCDREFGVGFTSTSINSLENTSSAKHCTKTTTVDDHDSVSHSKPVVIINYRFYYFFCEPKILCLLLIICYFSLSFHLNILYLFSFSYTFFIYHFLSLSLSSIYPIHPQMCIGHLLMISLIPSLDIIHISNYLNSANFFH